MQAIDVVVLTRNSGHLLEKCLKSIYDNVPVMTLIVIDGFSTDNTLEIVDQAKKKWGSIQVLQINGSRARAREAGIRQVQTDWFMFVDSDVILSKDWFRKAEKNMIEKVGAVWGVNIDVIPNVSQDKRFVKLQSLVAKQCFSLRGGMHDTLIRREAVAGIKIPEELHAYEDSFIVKWIEEKGYKVLVGDDIYCLHFKPPDNWNLENGISQAVLELKCGLVYSHNYEYVAFYPFFFFYWVLQLSLQGLRGVLAT